MAYAQTDRKYYSAVMKEAVPAAVSLVDAGDNRRRANAAGPLTNLADECPENPGRSADHRTTRDM